MRLLSVALGLCVFAGRGECNVTVTLTLGEECVNDDVCAPEESRCSVCVDEDGRGRCLKNFIEWGWFTKQCTISDQCQKKCKFDGMCVSNQKEFLPTCFCSANRLLETCSGKQKPGYVGLRMLQWRRKNTLVAPGEITTFRYRAVAERNVIGIGLYKSFRTSFGHTQNMGEKLRESTDPPSDCAVEGVLCIDESVNLQFPYLEPDNNFNVTVFKRNDRLRGYIASVEAKFKTSSMQAYVGYEYKVFVDYSLKPSLKCLAVIQLKNCAHSIYNNMEFTFHRNEFLTIVHRVKFLEDAAFESTAKENREKCSLDDTIWSWTWSRFLVTHGLETQGEEKTEIGQLLRIKPFTLDFGMYRVSLRIKRVFDGSYNENYDECFFKVKPWPLTAIIDGGEIRRVEKAAGLTLGASKSYDPNQPGSKQGTLRVMWTCECLTKNISFCENTCAFNKVKPYRWLRGVHNNVLRLATKNISLCENTCAFNKVKPYKWLRVHERLYFKPSQLQYDAQYRFTATVGSQIKYHGRGTTQRAYVTIKVAGEHETVVSNYDIECARNCQPERTLPNEIIFLKARVYENEVLIKSKIEFDWLCERKNDSVKLPIDELKVEDLPSNLLAIKENALGQGTVYEIRLTERNKTEVLALYSFRTAMSEYVGSCKVDPSSGVQGVTNFDIICDGADEYIFEFYDKNEDDVKENILFNGRMLGTSEYLGTIESVKLTRGTVAVYIFEKNSGLYTRKIVKVKLSSRKITPEFLEEILKNLTATVRLGDFSSIMDFVSFIPDVIPDWVDKSEMLQTLLQAMRKVDPDTVADVKLSASTVKTVLQTMNRQKAVEIDLKLLGSTLVLMKNQMRIIGHHAAYRQITKWMSSEEIREVTTTVLDCLDVASKNQEVSTAKLNYSFQDVSFDKFIVLKDLSYEMEKIMDSAKLALAYSHDPGLPPAKLESSDKSFRIWAMGDDPDHRVTDMLKKDESIPIALPKNFLKTYKDKKKPKEHVLFQGAHITRNIFSWSEPKVKSKLVSLNMFLRKENQLAKKVKFLNSNILVRVDMDRNATEETVEGETRQLDLKMDPDECDLRIKVHRIDTPPKALVRITFLFPPNATSGALRVLTMDDFRPDCEVMARLAIHINSSNPEYPVPSEGVDMQRFLYMGILPAEEVPVNSTVPYKFRVTFSVCQLWVGSQWSSTGCSISPMTTRETTVCSCNHLSIFGALFPVPPQDIDPIGDAKLFLTVLDNPVVVLFVIVCFILYLLALLWGRIQDRHDRYKGLVIILEDNFPEDKNPYLVAVHTSKRFNAGTTAHVGILLFGTEGSSRAHILSCRLRKVLKRGSDDWFMIYTPKPLGDVYEIQIWHDNHGSSPEWHCSQIVVYDISRGTEALFIVEQWLALREGDFPEAILVLASDQEMQNMKRLFLTNSLLGFVENHTFISVFARHPRSEVSRPQRVSILMCFIMVAMLCDIMFYRPPNYEYPTDEYQYDVGSRDIMIGIETTLISGGLTIIVVFAFRNSYKVVEKRQHTTLIYRKDPVITEVDKGEDGENVELERKEQDSESEDDLKNQGKSTRHKDPTFFKSYSRFVATYLKNPPLSPVYVGEDERIIQRRLFWWTLAWVSCLTVILISAYLVMLYGLKLGKVQSQKWLTSLVMSMAMDIFIANPGRIILFAILLALAFTVQTKVDVHGIDIEKVMAARPAADKKYVEQLLERRKHPMYLPLSSNKREVLMRKKILRRRWWSLVDFVNIACYVVIVSAVIYRLWTSHFYDVKYLQYMFSVTNREEYGGVDLADINNMLKTNNYFEVSLFEALFNLRWYNNKPMTSSKDEDEPEGLRRYWAKSGLHKMIGQPRIRQNRVAPQKCSNVYFKHLTKCLLSWSLGNKDTNIYGERWQPATYVDVIKKDSPWQYRNTSNILWWTNQRFFGIYGDLYDANGFFTSIGKTMTAAQKTFNELRANNWQDWYTRACFLTTTVYNVNNKVFSQVTVLFEYFIDRTMVASVTVIPVNRDILFGVWELLFILYAIWYIFRSGYLINQLGLLDYLSTVSNSTRVIGVVLALLCIGTWIVHHRTSITYTQHYLKYKHDDHFDFDSFVGTYSILTSLLSALLCLTIMRTFLLLQGGRRFLNVYYTLIISIRWLVWLTSEVCLGVFILTLLQNLLSCHTYFTVQQLFLPTRMTALADPADFERSNLKVFVTLRMIMIPFLKLLFVVLFMHYLKIGRVYRIMDSDSFDFVTFLTERLKACEKRRKWRLRSVR